MTETAASQPSAKPGSAAVLCFLVAALEGYDIQSFGVAAPALAKQLGLGDGGVGVAGAAAMAGLMIGAFAGGWLAEKRGPKIVLIISTLLFALFSIASAMAQSFEWLLLARFATGIGFGGAMPNLIAVAMRLRPEGKHASLTTAIFCGMPVGGAIVGLLARSMGADLDWRMLFAIGGVAPLLLVPLLYTLLPDFPPAPREERNVPLGFALFGEGRWATTTMLWIAFALTLLLLYLLLNWLPSLIVAKQFSPADGATASLAFNLSGIAGSLLLGVLADKWGFRWPVAFGFIILFFGMMALAQTQSFVLILACAGLMGASVVGLQYLLYAFAPVPYPAVTRVSAAGAALAVGRFGSIGGPLLAGYLREAGYSADDLLKVLLPVVVVAAVAALLATRAKRTTGN